MHMLNDNPFKWLFDLDKFHIKQQYSEQIFRMTNAYWLLNMKDPIDASSQ